MRLLLHHIISFHYQSMSSLFTYFTLKSNEMGAQKLTTKLTAFFNNNIQLIKSQN